MFYLGVIDVLTIVCNSLISGYFTITGSVYCAQPTVTYVSGCFAVGKTLYIYNSISLRKPRQEAGVGSCSRRLGRDTCAWVQLFLEDPVSFVRKLHEDET